jgi:multisubunit Na+/H+ antiporter MnhB subunit
MTGSFVDFRITPKGDQVQRKLPVRVIAPYIVLAGICAAAMALAADGGGARGFQIFAAINLVIYVSLAILVVVRHASENDQPLLPQSQGLRLAVASGLVACLIGGAQLGNHGLTALEALSHGQPFVTFTQSQFTVAGAGLGGGKTRIVKFRLKWHGFAEAGHMGRGIWESRNA